MGVIRDFSSKSPKNVRLRETLDLSDDNSIEFDDQNLVVVHHNDSSIDDSEFEIIDESELLNESLVSVNPSQQDVGDNNGRRVKIHDSKQVQYENEKKGAVRVLLTRQQLHALERLSRKKGRRKRRRFESENELISKYLIGERQLENNEMGGSIDPPFDNTRHGHSPFVQLLSSPEEQGLLHNFIMNTENDYDNQNELDLITAPDQQPSYGFKSIKNLSVRKALKRNIPLGILENIENMILEKIISSEKRNAREKENSVKYTFENLNPLERMIFHACSLFHNCSSFSSECQLSENKRNAVKSVTLTIKKRSSADITSLTDYITKSRLQPN